MPIVVCYDCTTAGHGGFASSAASASLHPGCAFSLSDALSFLRQCAQTLVPLTPRHVRGHADIFENDLVDFLAKRARRTRECYYERLLPRWPGRLLRHRLAPWAWLLLDSRPDMPVLSAMEAEAARMQAHPHAVTAPALPESTLGSHPVKVHLKLRFFTYNVLTMRDPCASDSGVCPTLGAAGMRFLGRRDLVKQQLLQMQVLFAGLQETRLPDTATLPDADFHMLHAACTEHGHYGTALWVNKRQAYGFLEGRPLTLEMHHLAVVHHEPRAIAVRVQAHCLDLLVAVLHVPHATCETDSAESFWKRIESRLGHLLSTTSVVLLLDANGRLGSEISEAGSLWPEAESPPGAILHSFMLRYGLCAPSTDPACHAGPSATWISPSGACHRLDYIVLPESWRTAVGTWVQTSFESLQCKHDHFPVVAHCEFTRGASDRPYRDAPKRQVVRPPPTADPGSLQCFDFLCQQQPDIGWDVNVDAHYCLWSQQVVGFWHDCYSVPVAEPKQAYLSADTLRVVHMRRAYREYAHAEECEKKRCLLLLGFAGLLHCSRGTHFAVSHICKLDWWLAALDLSIARAAVFLRSATKQIRSLVRRDRQAYLQSLADGVVLADVRDPKALFAAVRRAYPQTRSARKSSFMPLPKVLRTDGTCAPGPLERAECWRQHFADQEAGEVVDQLGYQTVFNRQRPYGHDCRPAFDISCVPTLQEVEKGILALRKGKGVGPDCISAELLQTTPRVMARRLLPIMVKASVGVQEPVLWRGGYLCCLAKRAHISFTCKDFRSILLASVPGKLYHRTVRTRLLGSLDQLASPLQAGARPGIGVDSVTMVARAFQSYSQASSQFSGLLFFDICAAYYRMLRQRVVPFDEPEEQFLKLLRTLDVPGEAMTELYAHLGQLTALEAAQTNDHMIAIVSDLCRGTWFRLDRLAVLTVTHRGSRPGDPLADILFSFSLSMYLQSCERALSKASLLTSLPTPVSAPLQAEIPVSQSLGFLSWADDLLRLLIGDSMAQLVAKVTAVMQVCVEHAAAAGISFSFDKHKTSVMLPEPPPHVRLPGGVWESPPEELLIHNRVTQQQHVLQVVPAYQHLGSVLAADGTPTLEIQHRRSLALGSTRSLVFKLYANPRISLQVRKTLLRSLAVSRFVFGSPAVCFQAGHNMRLWCRTYVDLWRRLLRRVPASERQPHSFEVLGYAGVCSPTLALSLARAALLKRLLAHGPPEALFILQRHWELRPRKSWLGQVLQDISLVAQHQSAARVLVHTACPLRALFDALQQDASWWVRTVRGACRVSTQDHVAYFQQVQRHGRDAVEVEDALSRPADQPRTHVCPDCGAAFYLNRHLATHRARAHGSISPARVFAPTEVCLSCLRLFHSVPRVQQHLKENAACLTRRRLVHLIPPLTLSEVAQAEGPSKALKRALKGGRWQRYTTHLPPQQTLGPRLPTGSEVSSMDELDVIGHLRAPFWPRAADVAWITAFHASRSREGPRTASTDFWLQRPRVSPSLPEFWDTA